MLCALLRLSLLSIAILGSPRAVFAAAEGWYEISREEVPATQFFTPQEIERAADFRARGMWFWFGSMAIEFSFWALLLCCGIGRGLLSIVRRVCGERYGSQCAVFVLLVLTLHALVLHPLAVASYYHRLANGLSNQTLAQWHLDRLLAVGVNVLLTTLGVVLAYLVMRRWPRRWWISVASAGAIVVVLGMYVYPVLIAPIFNNFRPLEDGPLKRDLLALCERCDIDVESIHVMDGSRRSPHVNAYFAGLGNTRRIVLYDTLVDEHSREEVTSILAHEIGHWRRRHIWKGMVCAALGTLVLLLVIDRVLSLWARRSWCGVTTKASLLGLPLFFLTISVGSTLTLPLQNAISRHFEREADDEELALTGRPDLLISAMKRMAVTNLSEVEPDALKERIFYSHPSTMNRIRRAVAEERQGAE